MPTIEQLFAPHTARASAFADYVSGDVAYVTNGLRDNGVRRWAQSCTRVKAP